MYRDEAYRSFLTMCLLIPALTSAQASWPDLPGTVASLGEAKGETALILAIENYSYLPRIPGAQSNAVAWQKYLVKVRGLPSENVVLLPDDRTPKEVSEEFRRLASRARKRFWFVFIGHGAPQLNKVDPAAPYLVVRDAQQRQTAIYESSIRLGDLHSWLQTLNSLAEAVLIVDSCFSGRTHGNEADLLPGAQLTTPIAPRFEPTNVRSVLATASPQLAGALPRGNRPAFTYLLLGTLLGWNHEGANALTATQAISTTSDLLARVRPNVNQQPEVKGAVNLVIASLPTPPLTTPPLDEILRIADPPQKFGTLNIRANVTAKVWLNDILQPDRTPLSMQLIPGRYMVRIGAEGHREQQGEVEVKKDQITEFIRVLERSEGYALVILLPQVDDVSVNLGNYTITPGTPQGPFAPGTYPLRVKAPGYRAYEREVQLRDSKDPTSIQVMMEPDLYGTLSITTQPEATLNVEIAGARVGQTPLTNLRLPTGVHLVKLTGQGWRPVSFSIKIEQQQDVERMVQLQRAEDFLDIRVTPPDVDVQVKLNDLPSSVGRVGPLGPGSYVVSAQANGFTLATNTIRLHGEGQVIPVELDLKPTRAKLKIQPNIEAFCEVAGQIHRVGTLGITLDLPVGTHEFRCHPGNSICEWKESATLLSGQTRTLRPKLNGFRRQGQIWVSCVEERKWVLPLDASVFFPNAQKVCAQLMLDDGGWRLPTEEELEGAPAGLNGPFWVSNECTRSDSSFCQKAIVKGICYNCITRPDNEYDIRNSIAFAICVK